MNAHQVRNAALHLILAVVLLVAASFKAQSLLVSVDFAIGWKHDAQTWMNRLAVLVEWALAAWLLSGITPLLASRAMMGLLIVFIAVSGWSLFQGETDCGCFGDYRVHPGWTFAFDVIALVALIWCAHHEHANPPTGNNGINRGPRIAFATALSIALPAAVLGSTYFRNATSDSMRQVMVDPTTWAGDAFPLLDFIDDDAVRTDLATDRRTVILFNRDCGKCREHLKTLAGSARSNAELDEVRAIDIGLSTRTMIDMFQSPFPEIKLRSGVRYIGSVPWEVSLEDGTVKSAHQPD